MNSKRVSCAGKRVYIGLDVHRSFFVASCVCEGEVVKRCRMPSKSVSVISLISKYFPESEVKSCYESGYSGFWLHRELEAAGIENIVIHAAAVEVAANDRVKTDKRDSLKLAEQLAAGRLKGIRVPSLEEEYQRLLPRTREQFMRARRRVQTQIRMRLHQFGLFPEHIQRVLRMRDVEDVLEHINGELKQVIELLYAQWVYLDGEVKRLDRCIAEQGKRDPLDAIYRSVPGIGTLTARVLSNELGDMSQFQNVRALYSFVGLTPGEYSSGDKIRRGHISRQGNSWLRHLLVEAAWIAVRKDLAMKEYFERLAKRTGKKKAIVAVARKLIGKVRAAIRDAKMYELEHKETA